VPREWRGNPAISGGGVMFDVGSHRLDVMVYLFGEVEKVSAFTETLHCGYRVEDSAVLSMKFTNGIHGTANFNWNVKSDSDEFEIYGTEGKILARPLEEGMKTNLIMEAAYRSARSGKVEMVDWLIGK
jgi:predicted dehydrogenase